MTALLVLATTFIQTSQVAYVFAKYTEEEAHILGESVDMKVDYTFAYPGKVSPDNTMWIFKAIRDRIAYQLTIDPTKKAEMALVLSDKRIIYAKELFKNEKGQLALSTLTKAEKYLDEASIQIGIADSQKKDTAPFLRKLVLASIKHRMEIDEIISIAPESLRPEIIKIQDYSKNVYNVSRDSLNSKGVESPKNPYNQ